MKSILKSLKQNIYRLGISLMLANVFGTQFFASSVSADPSLPNQNLRRQIEAISAKSDQQQVHSFDLYGDGKQVLVGFADSPLGEDYYLVQRGRYLDAYNTKAPSATNYAYFDLCVFESLHGGNCYSTDPLTPANEYYDKWTGVRFRLVSATPNHLEQLFTLLKFLKSKGN